jgi:glyceraldehyde-3-phosphate dehydrogenase/erythrose-4-phosphate dehydrogenase
MGTFGFTEIVVNFEQEATEEEIDAFFKEIKDNKELESSVKDKEVITISSQRLANLSYQEGIFNDIVKKHSCVYEALGNSFIESDSSVYYVKGDKE